MGLAASQARLLTITSRLSSVEMRQQRIAMDKMRLASDTDKISEKYTNAINNKTLSISNGSEEVPMTYSALASHGYSVMRASDGVIASSASSNGAGVTNASSASGASNATNTTTSNSTTTTTVNPEIQKWIGQPAPTQPTFTETAPIAPSQRLNAPTPPIASNVSIQLPNFSDALSAADTCANYSYDTSSSSSSSAMGNLMNTMNKNTALKYKAALDTSVQNLINELQNSGYTSTASQISKAKTQAQGTYEMKNFQNIFGNNSSSNNSMFGGMLGTKKSTPENEYASSIKDAINNAQNGIFQTELNNKKQAENAKADAEKNAQYQADLEAYNQNQQEWNTYNTKKAEYDQKYQAYQAQLNQYNVDYANWVTANSSSNSSEGASKAGQTTGASSGSTTIDNSGSTGSTRTTGTTGVSAAASQELAEQLKNTQFLIQGLLSGYLALVKDGQQVSLSSATDIIESYDKSDDAAAEAEYNAETNKINRKEKMLDMQAKRLDTEYSALTNEYNSVKTIIDNHAQKDFEYLS